MMRIVLVLCCTGIALAQVTSDAPKTSSVHNPATTSSSIHLMTSSAPPPTTTTTARTTNTAIPTTTTATPTTSVTPATTAHSSSKHPSSTLLPTSSITPSPATSSVTPPSSITTPKPTTPKPTTPAPPSFGDFSVKNKNGKYCLLAQMKAMFTVKYTQQIAVNKTKEASVNISTPTNISEYSTSKSQCEVNGTSKLVITWPINKDFYTFEIDFKGTVAKSLEAEMNYTDWEVSEVRFMASTVNNSDFINATEDTIQVHVNGSEFTAFKGKMNGYYQCSPDKTYDLESNVKATIEHVKLQPFMMASVNETYTGDLMDCESENPTKKPDDEGDIVPIAVGCALAGLVLIVLIAYIVGRRKSQRGYEKV